LDKAKGDTLILGGSNPKHIEANIASCQNGPLPEELLQVIDEAEKVAAPAVQNYFRSNLSKVF
jgi:aflatoxin B1 aldehyde reductase